MDQLLWNFDEVARFVQHPDTSLRRWTLERLIKLFPDRAGGPLVHLLDDPNSYCLIAALDLPRAIKPCIRTDQKTQAGKASETAQEKTKKKENALESATRK
jgi:hypothetical protein